MDIKKYLIEDWKKCYKFLSVQISVIIALLALLPSYVTQLQPYGVNEKYLGVIAIVGILARVIQQEKKGGPDVDQNVADAIKESVQESSTVLVQGAASILAPKQEQK